MKLLSSLLLSFFVSSLAFADSVASTELRSTNGVKITITNAVDEIVVSLPDAQYSDSRYDGTIKVVLINRCQTGTTPPVQEKVLQAETRRSGSYPILSNLVFPNPGFGSGANCTNEIAVFTGNQWLVDPVTNLHNFKFN